ncbi:DUF4105 domain-containing protein [Psychrobacter sp.]|uniref:Lnb N-terminal periplasmic domain-containing protein n=1 Tax=Psychrobacter sp. TaxID=56811 RepID=UPI0025F1465A|nr:DUF4105 domain-containing protein [Psychrobacter sp.]
MSNNRTEINISKFDKPAIDTKKPAIILAKSLCFLVFLVASLWAGLVCWVHLIDYSWIRWLSVIGITLLSIITIKMTLAKDRYWQRWLAGFGILWIVLLVWYEWLPPRQDRPWMSEVSQVLQFSQNISNPNLITLHNVRNFDWVRASGADNLRQPTEPYFFNVDDEGDQDVVAQERWSERTIDISKLNGVDIINSYWMGEQIGHTLLSFTFQDERPLSFSIEIRKEKDESFSAFGGFVRQFELALVASEERDIVYTRSNVRGEQVYIFPIQGLSQQQVQQLFMAYLHLAKELQQAPTWYNTLTKNCTTVLFNMARNVDATDFPWDYRVVVSGYVPNYLYDQGLLPKQLENQQKIWTINQWYTQAHVNPKVANFSFENNKDPEAYSKLIRQGLPQPVLKP